MGDIVNSFIHPDFLLYGDTAKNLFHTYAEHLPIIDYHCHLNPKEIRDDRHFRNLYDAWLSTDHYKWRLLRANGVPERLITGDASDAEKFAVWAALVPDLMGNPLYHWTHLELKRIFGIDELLSPETASSIEAQATAALSSLSVRSIITKMGVEIICTTDDPIDPLDHHEFLATERLPFRVLPTFRPDRAVNVDSKQFPIYLASLSAVVGFPITSIEEWELAMSLRLDAFHAHGCRLADHGLDRIGFAFASRNQVARTFALAATGNPLTETESAGCKAALLIALGRQYHARGWVMQYHIGAIRNNNARMFNALGPDFGFDAINDRPFIEPLRDLLNALDGTDELPKTILYTINPSGFEAVVTLMQAFQGGGVAGKLQFGSAWWFLDSIDGITRQLKALAANGLLSRFVGMLTDSRSILSYPRHEYFRRILCNVIGDEVDQGRYPADLPRLARMVKDICHDNAERFFGFNR